MSEPSEITQRSGGLAGHAGMVSIAAGVAQALGLVAILIATKALSKEGFGHYSVYLSHAAILIAFVLLALPKALPNLTDDEIPHFTYGILFVGTINSLLLYLGYSLCGYRSAAPLALYVGAFGVHQLHEMLCVRTKAFSALAAARIAPFALLPLSFIGLITLESMHAQAVIWCHALSFSVVAAVLGVRILRMADPLRFSGQAALQLLWRERAFPLLNAPADLSNLATFNIPTILIEQGLPNGLVLAGQYKLVTQLCFAPVGIMGGAIGQVFHGHLAGHVRENGQADQAQYRRVRNSLLGMGFLLTMAVIAVFPILIDRFYGEGWSLAKTFVYILAPLAGIRLLVTPLTRVLIVFKKLKFYCAAQLASLAVTILAILAAVHYTSDATIAVGSLSAVSVIYHLLLLVGIERVRGREKHGEG